MSEPYILIIETATEICSVAVTKGNNLLACKETNKANSHSTLINDFIIEVVEKAELNLNQLHAIAVSEGPGSYTGLRIGASAAKALAYSLNKPLLAFNTLKSLASGIVAHYTHNNQFQYISTIDARRNELYMAIYDHQLNEILSPINYILPNEELNAILTRKKCLIAGNAAMKLNDLQDFECKLVNDEISVSAVNAVQLVNQKFLNQNFSDVAYFEPNYIKPFYTTAKKIKL